MVRFRLTSFAFSLLLITANTFQARPAGAADPDSLHWTSWDRALTETATVPALRFAFYAYRTLAVPNPEVYLRADALFSEIVEKMPGSRVAFKGANVRDVELFRRLRDGTQQGPSFTWKMWAPTADSIYDAPEPRMTPSWLDLRVAPASVILTAISPRMTTAESAMMRYTQLRRGGQPDSSLFVMIDQAGHGYLAQNGVLLSPQTGRPWDGDAGTLVPALVFNERHVFYPLFGRDDRPKNPELSRLMESLAAPAFPVFSSSDSLRALTLSSAAALPTKAAKELAVIAALGGAGIEHPAIRYLWGQMLGHPEDNPLGCEKGMLRMIVYWANRLSPRTALLAATVTTDAFDSIAPALKQQYLERCGRRVDPRDTTQSVSEAGGYLWAFELLELTFDDIIRTRAGAGSSQALAMAAVLDLLAIPNVQLEIDTGDNLRPNQHWILADGGRWQFNYGDWKLVGTIPETASRIPLLVTSYTVAGRWASLSIPRLYCDADDMTIASDLTRMAVMMPSVSPVLRNELRRTMTFAEFMKHMADNQTQWLPLPWPGMSETGLQGGTGSP